MKDFSPKIIGGFIVGAIILVIIVFVIFGSGKYFEERLTYVTYFRDSIEGLGVGAPVKIRGVTIGSVTIITPLFDMDNNFLVEVIFETKGNVVKSTEPRMRQDTYHEEIEYLIRDGLRARLQTESLVTGKLFVSVDFYPEAEIILVGLNDDYPEVPSIPTAMEELGTNLEKSISSISQIQFAEISRSLIQTLEGMDILIRSPELKQTIKSLDRSLRVTEVLFRNMDGRTDSLTNVFVKNSESLDRFLSNAERLLIQLNEIAATNRYELHEVLQELTRASEAYYNLAEYLGRHPEAIIQGKD